MRLYKTKDLGEAAALVANNIKLFKLEKDPAGFYWFIFHGEKIEDIANAYWSDDLIITAKKFNDCLKSLKDRLYANR